jgi:restriction endonuclease S subunit
MDGLECSEVLFSDFEQLKLRIDSEYYQKSYLHLEKKIKSLPNITIKDMQVELDCSAFYPAITDEYNFDGEGVPFLRVNEIQNGLVEISSNTAFLPQYVLDANKKTIAIAYKGDILIAKGGNTLAKVGLVTDDYPQYAVSRDIIILRTGTRVNHNKYYLWAFLHSKYGQMLLWRTASQTGQPHLTLPSIQELTVPVYSNEFENVFEEVYCDSVDLKNRANLEMDFSQKYVLEVLGIKGFITDVQNSTIKNFSQSFITSGRLDAEYYQPKYDEIENAIQHFNTTSIVNEFDVFKNSCSEYEEDGDIGVIKTKQITNGGIIEIPESFIKSDVVINNKLTLLKKGDVVFAAMGVGSLGKVCVYYGETGFVTDSTLKIFRKKCGGKIEPEVLTLFLQSRVGQEIIYKYVVGSTGIINIYDSDIFRIPIPILDDTIQKKLVEKARNAFSLKDRSSDLLKQAKQAIEMVIEQGEEKAMKFLETIQKGVEENGKL